MADFPFGYSTCNYLINLLCMSDNQVEKYFQNGAKPSTLKFIMCSIYAGYKDSADNDLNKENANDLFLHAMIPFLEMITKSDVKCDFSKMRFVICRDGKTGYLSEDNYEKFRNILKERNCLMDVDGTEAFENPSNEMARKLLEKRRMLNERLQKSKKRKGEDDSLTMADLISIYAEAQKMPLQTVYAEYDVYQFNNQFNRLKIMEDYQVNIKALLAGAKSESVKLQHWLSKIKNQNY